MNPKGILLIFLPPLIFEGAFNSDWYIFRKQSYQIFILAFPSVLLSALCIMFSLKVIVGFDSSFYDWPQLESRFIYNYRLNTQFKYI